MNGYLVQLIYVSEDIPVRLCATEAEAKAVAESYVESDSATAMAVGIVEFKDGQPVRDWWEKDFADEEETKEGRLF